MPPQKLLEDIAGVQAQLEQYRRQLLGDRARAFKITGWTGGVWAGLWLLVLVPGFEPTAVLLLILAGLCVLVVLTYAACRASALSAAYRKAYKREINNAIVKHFSPGLRYDEDDGISQREFVASHLFGVPPDRYTTGDLVSGVYGKTQLRFARVHAEQKHTESTKKGTRTHYTTIFRGILLIADFNKHFRGRTCARTDVAEKLMGNFGRVFQKFSVSLSSDQLVQLENPEFEKEFAVYTSDQVEARYILTPALMERMLDLKRRCGNETQFSFCGSSVVVAITNSADLFDPDFSRPATNAAQLADICDRYAFFLGIIEDLDLNTRVWSKE